MRTIAIILVVMGVLSVNASAQVDVPITVTDHANVRRSAWPVSGGVPFPKGYLKPADLPRLTLVNKSGKVVSTFQKPVVLGKWPDGSIRWALLDFAADVPAGGKSVYRLKTVTRKTAPTTPAIEVTETESSYVVDTGLLKAVLNRNKFSFLERVWLDANGDGKYVDSELVVTSPGEMFVDLDGAAPGARDTGVEEHSKGDKQYFGIEGGNWLRDSKSEKSTRFLASSGDYELTIFRRGSMHTVFRLEGFHKSGAGRQFAKYTLYIHFYAGKSHVRVLHTWIMTGDPEKDFIRRMGITVPLKSKAKTYAFGGEFERHTNSLPKRKPSKIKSGRMSPTGEAYILSVGPDKYYHNMPARLPRNRRKPANAPPAKDLRVKYTVVVNGKKKAAGHEPSGWGDFTDGKTGLAVGVRDFYREHPKEINYRDGDVTLYIWPDHGRKSLDLRRCGTESRGGYEQVGKRARRVNGSPGSAVGLAKTTELLFYFHKNNYRKATVDAVFASLDEPLLPFAGARWNCATGVWGPLKPYDRKKHPELENFIDVSFHWMYLGQREFSWYGMLDWGDSLVEYGAMSWELPNWPSNRGVYSNWGYAGWSSEWDPGQMMLVQYFRSGRWEHFRYGEAKVRHQRDVDCVYWEKPDNGPLPRDNNGRQRLGGGHRHNQQHWGTYLTGYAQPNISIGHLYYLTGEGRCLDAYRDIAKYHAYASSIENEGRLTLAYIGEVLGEKKWTDIARTKMERSGDCRPRNSAFGRTCVANMTALMLWDISSGDPAVRKKLIEWGDTLDVTGKQGSEATIVLWAYLKKVEKSNRWDAKIKRAYSRIIPKNFDGLRPSALPRGVWKLSLDEAVKCYYGTRSPVALFAVHKPPGFFPIPRLAYVLGDVK